MASKVNPYTLRLGINKVWNALWFARKNKYTEYLLKDHKIREILKEHLKDMAISRVSIERSESKVKLIIHTGKPGLLIGKQGVFIENLKNLLHKKTGEIIDIQVVEVSQPDIDARIVADTIALQIEKRINYKRAMKQAVAKAMEKGAKGIKVLISGRLGGNEIARSEWIAEGRIPLQTLRADIDFAIAEAQTSTGKLGIKVWIFKGFIFDKKNEEYNINLLNDKNIKSNKVK